MEIECAVNVAVAAIVGGSSGGGGGGGGGGSGGGIRDEYMHNNVK